MTIKLLTLKSTQTLIGDLDCTDDKTVVMKQPVQVIIQQTKEGPMMGFAPFLEFSDDFKTGIKFPMDAVMCITSPVRELENQYNTTFGSGIQIASSIPNM